MKVAAIDIGTNSVLCLIAEGSTSHALRALSEHATITRLGENVDATGQLAPAAVERTLSCLERYATALRDAGVTEVAAVGTSALRDAEGGHTFSDQAERILGTRPTVISGEREAQLTFDGALSGLDPEGKLAVFDIGGGSTEVIVGRRIPNTDATLHTAVSLDVGSVRLTERHLVSDPPTSDELEAVRQDIRSALGRAPTVAGLPLVGVAGTMTTLAAIAYDIVPYDPRQVHGAVLSQEVLEETLWMLASKTLSERRALPALAPKRADVIVAGACIASELCALAGADRIIVSDRGVRWGLARELATRLDKRA